MESAKRIVFGLSYFAFIFGGTLFLYQHDSGLAILFNMACLGALSSYIAHSKQRNKVGWFFIGLFTGIIGVAIAIGIKPKGGVHGE